MLTLQWIQLTCPVCDTTFESMTAVRDDAEDAATATEPTSAISAGVLPYFVHVCRRCGYAGAFEETPRKP